MKAQFKINNVKTSPSDIYTSFKIFINPCNLASPLIWAKKARKNRILKKSLQIYKLGPIEAQTRLTDESDPLNPRPKMLGPTCMFSRVLVKFSIAQPNWVEYRSDLNPSWPDPWTTLTTINEQIILYQPICHFILIYKIASKFIVIPFKAILLKLSVKILYGVNQLLKIY